MSTPAAFAADLRFSFGTGKVNALAGFTSAVILLGFALTMVLESFDRFLNPVQIAFDQALLVAIIGLAVNVISAWILASSGDHSHEHNHDHSTHHDDHNLRAAYLHVITDALTSILAIFALLAGKWFGLGWMDPAMGIIGTIVVSHWSFGLIRNSSQVILDCQASETEVNRLQDAIEKGTDDRIADIHMWSIAPGKYSAEIVIVSHERNQPGYYRERIPNDLNIVHATIEVRECKS